jgi:hypothetical protein
MGCALTGFRPLPFWPGGSQKRWERNLAHPGGLAQDL